MTLKQKLANILEDFNQPGRLDELWKNLENTNDTKSFTIDFDAESGKIDIHSQNQNAQGQPVLEWSLDTNKGDIISTTRNVTTNSERVVEKTIDVATLHNPDPVPVAVVAAMNSTISDTPKAQEAKSATSAVVSPAPATTTTATTTAAASANTTVAASSSSSITANWDDMEMQRDVAFKIVYFFILFIIATFGLLYAYFKMSQKENMEKERKARAKSIFYGEPSQQTFFDFLAG